MNTRPNTPPSSPMVHTVAEAICRSQSRRANTARGSIIQNREHRYSGREVAGLMRPKLPTSQSQ